MAPSLTTSSSQTQQRYRQHGEQHHFGGHQHRCMVCTCAYGTATSQFFNTNTITGLSGGGTSVYGLYLPNSSLAAGGTTYGNTVGGLT